uniref:C2 domain-containing protein n=1 Tax=Acrobeloides nanus TaxID=290746 RepID=A0A914E1P9_9BILA
MKTFPPLIFLTPNDILHENPEFSPSPIKLASPRENMQINWLVSGDIVQDQSRSFVTHWTKGSPDDISLTCQIVGTDPTFGFARVCDETQPVKIFKQAIQPLSQIRSRRHEESQPTPTLDEVRMIVEVRGKCFNATLAVQKHVQRCPWCPDPNLQIHHESQPDSEIRSSNPTFFNQLHNQEQYIQMIVFIGLAAIIVITSTSCTCLLILYLKQKKRNSRGHRNSNSKQSLQYNGMISSCHHYHQVLEPLKGQIIRERVEDLCYETPWDKKYRPLPHILSSSSSSSGQKSECTTTSPLTSTSALGSMYEQTSGSSLIDQLHAQGAPTTVLNTSTLNGENYNYVSPNSILSRNEDSGLETV